MTPQSQALALFQITKFPRHPEKLPGMEMVHVALNCPLEGSRKGYVQNPLNSEVDIFRVDNAQQNCWSQCKA